MSGTSGTTESNVLNNIGEYAKTNFVINWASGSVIAILMFYGIFQYFENAKLKEGIDSQKITITELKKVTSSQGKTIEHINSTFSAIKTTVEAFTAHPPSAYDEKINGIYRIIGVYHSNNSNNHAPPALHTVQPVQPSDTTVPARTEE